MSSTKEWYEERGYKDRYDYLFCMARDYEVPYDTVIRLARQLGEREDFGELVRILESMEEENQ